VPGIFVNSLNFSSVLRRAETKLLSKQFLDMSLLFGFPCTGENIIVVEFGDISKRVPVGTVMALTKADSKKESVKKMVIFGRFTG
jgi:hypothetical protein